MHPADSGHNPRKALWQEVLLRTVEEALLGPQMVPNRAKAIQLCIQARVYLTRPSDDLTTVCSLAGIDPDAMMERMRGKIAAAPTPADLINGKRANRAVMSKRKDYHPKKRTKHTITYEGETLALAEWSLRTGLAASTIYRRNAQGWTAHDTLTMTAAQGKERARERERANKPQRTLPAIAIRPKTCARGTPGRTYTHDGHTLTLAQWAEHTGIKKQTITKRIRVGLTIAEAVTLVDLRRKAITLQVEEMRVV